MAQYGIIYDNEATGSYVTMVEGETAKAALAFWVSTNPNRNPKGIFLATTPGGNGLYEVLGPPDPAPRHRIGNKVRLIGEGKGTG